MSPLRVGFDYWLAATHGPGVGRYVRELVRALARIEAAPRISLLDFGPPGEDVPEAALGLDAPGIVRRRLRARRGWLRASERFLGLRAETWLGPLDVFHRARLVGPPTARAPQLVALSERPQASDTATRESLSRMAAVLVFSERARIESMRDFGVRAEQLVQVPVGCDHWLRDLGTRKVARERPRILVLGAVRRERGHVEILQAFERLRGRGQGADLVICGRRGDEAARLEGALRASPVRTEVRWIDEPLESELPVLVAGSSVLVQLARDAWTAVTPLEAMSLGVAVVASRLPCFVEALGESADYVEADPSAPIGDGLDAALERALASSRDPAASLRRRALASAFTWDANARATMRVYERLRR